APESNISDELELAGDFVSVILSEWDFFSEPISDFLQSDELALSDDEVASIFVNGSVFANGFVHSDSRVSGGSEGIAVAADD
ncbi:hypothetical protein C1T30_43475, partial [Bacillus sp. MBGLi97]